MPNDPIVTELKEYLGDKFKKLPAPKKKELVTSYSKKRKSDSIYFWWFLSLHYAYLHKWWLFFLFLITISGFGVWWVIDLFRLSTILREYNKNVAINLLAGANQHDVQL